MLDHIGLSLPNDDGRLQEIIVDCLGDEPWCDRDPYGQREDERLISSWERFSEFIKYKRRYFFFDKNEGDELLARQEYLSPAELLAFIGKTATTMGLVKALPSGTLLYRARQQKSCERLHSSYDFAPPPL